MNRESINVIFQNDDTVFGEADGRYYLVIGESVYWLSDHPYGPCLYIKGADGTMMTIHAAFTVDELCRAARFRGKPPWTLPTRA